MKYEVISILVGADGFKDTIIKSFATLEMAKRFKGIVYDKYVGKLADRDAMACIIRINE